MPATRTVTGKYLKSDGSAWASATGTVTLLSENAIWGDSLLKQDIAATSDGSGDVSVAIPVPDSNAWAWIWKLPDGQTFRFALDAGAATTIAALQAAESTTTTADELTNLIANKVDKVVPAADVNIAVLDGTTGAVEDGGQTIAEIIAAVDVSAKADKSVPAATNNLATLSAAGNLQDGGKLISDVNNTYVDVESKYGTSRANIESALASNRTIDLGTGSYTLDQYVQLSSLSNVRIIGQGATVTYPSESGASAAIRSGFHLADCSNVTIQGIKFVGGSTVDDTTNTGGAVYNASSSDVHIVDCHNTGGYALYRSTNDAATVGLRITNCTSTDHVGYLATGVEDAVISGCRFTKSDDVSYDSPNTTHDIYLTAGHGKARITDCYFQNSRTNAIKISGSASAVGNVIISNCIFDDCANGIEYGADGATPDHDNLIITNNIFLNCGTNRSGWNSQYSVSLFGCRNVQILGNIFWYDRDNVVSATGRYAIYIRRHSSTAQPVESVIVKENQFTGILAADPFYSGSNGATASSAIVNGCVNFVDVGVAAYRLGSVLFEGNQISAVGQQAFQTQRVINLSIRFNEVRGKGVTAIWSDIGSMFPICQGNRHTMQQTSNASILLNKTSWPTIDGNFGVLTDDGTERGWGQYKLGIGSGGSASRVNFPLCGTHGRVAADNAGVEELVFAFGDGWVDGDTITTVGVTYTYRDSAPGANEFTTPAQLIALINASAWTCEDYGARFSTAVTTDHIRLWHASSEATIVRTSVTNATACVLLPTHASQHTGRAMGYSAGGDTITVWSPLIHDHTAVALIPDNSAAASQMASNSYYPIAPDSGVHQRGTSRTFNIGSSPAGTEEYHWMLR